jgi:ferrous iron transport protein A
MAFVRIAEKRDEFNRKYKRNITTMESEDILKKHKNKRKNLTELQSGESGIIAELKDGHTVVGKLKAMGIVPGVHIIKKSAAPMSGPIVLQKGSIQIAVGYGMAKHIIVDTIP